MIGLFLIQLHGSYMQTAQRRIRK